MKEKINDSARRNYLIDLLLQDPTYDVRKNGTIWTTRPSRGRHSNKEKEVWINGWRQVGIAITGSGRHAIGYYHPSYGQTPLLVSRIVYRKYHGLLLPGMHVDHRNGNSLDDRPNNLKQITPRGNIQKREVDRGGKQYAEITPNLIKEARVLYRNGSPQGLSMPKIAKKLNLSESTVRSIIRKTRGFKA